MTSSPEEAVFAADSDAGLLPARVRGPRMINTRGWAAVGMAMIADGFHRDGDQLTSWLLNTSPAKPQP